MKREKVSSSNIAAVGHDPDASVLEIEFHDGSVFSYPNVTAEEHDRFIKADSLGSHFHKHVRPKGGTRHGRKD